jgi:hypothetical protein
LAIDPNQRWTSRRCSISGLIFDTAQLLPWREPSGERRTSSGGLAVNIAECQLRYIKECFCPGPDAKREIFLIFANHRA